MGLAAEIGSLRDAVLEDLSRAYRYYLNTKIAWSVVQQYAEGGKTFSVRDAVTGTQTTEKELVALAPEYVRGYLVSATFQDFHALFEDFLFGLIGIWLPRFPHMIGDKMVAASEVFTAADLEAVQLGLVHQVVGDLRYKKVADWFRFLDKMVNLGCPSREEIGRIAEAKASRDVLVHNRGVVPAVYELKAGAFKRFSTGQTLDIPEDYHAAVFELFRKVVTDVADAAVAKAPD